MTRYLTGCLLMAGIALTACGGSGEPAVDDSPTVVAPIDTFTEDSSPTPEETATTPPPVVETTQAAPPPPVAPPPPEAPAAPADVYYKNCSEARAAGAAPLYRGDPGYRSGLDRDNDGVACES